MEQRLLDRIDSNLSRVSNLVELYKPSGQGRQPTQKTDILRAALVLLHASLEDFLRSLMVSKASQFDKVTLDKFPLLGSRNRNAQKFTLGELLAHREKSVEKLLTASVEDNLQKYGSYNDLGEVKDVLIKCGASPANVNDFDFGELPQMFARRHRIVHHADRNETLGGQGNHTIATIRPSTLERYIGSVRSLRDFAAENIE